ncbi:NRS ER [Fusarium heterosporum]|uniref:NRS ER n=1 Tax=Fusarium heterosporum TaxID=42747 RepID=A0A8H5WDI4_FUSHE|nr:NRS ER [Fusarium heterosporum]
MASSLNNDTSMRSLRFLIWSGQEDTRWLNIYLRQTCSDLGFEAHWAEGEKTESEIEDCLDVNPTHVFAIADDLGDFTTNINDKHVAYHELLYMAKHCERRGIHCTVFTCGNIYTYDDRHQSGDPRFTGFTEEDRPNYERVASNNTADFVFGAVSDISHTRKVLNDQCLVFRIRLPIFKEDCMGNYTTYMLRRCWFHVKHDMRLEFGDHRAPNVPNSYSVMHELLHAAVFLAVREVKGTFNLVNPGTMIRRDMLQILAQEMGPLLLRLELSFERDKAEGSEEPGSEWNKQDYMPDCRLSTIKLTQTLRIWDYPEIPDVKEAYRASIVRMKAAGNHFQLADDRQENILRGEHT